MQKDFIRFRMPNDLLLGNAVIQSYHHAAWTPMFTVHYLHNIKQLHVTINRKNGKHIYNLYEHLVKQNIGEMIAPHLQEHG